VSEENMEQEQAQSTNNMQDSIIHVQVLNWLLNNNDIMPLLNYEIDETYFPGYEAEYNYIMSYYETSKLKDGKGTVPDKVKFAYDFPDFPLFETGDAIKTMCEELLEQKCYSMFVQSLQEGAKKSKTSSFEAIEFIRNEMDTLHRFANKTMGNGTDLARQAGERLEDYIRRIETKGLLGIPCGLESMTKALHGWLPEDYVGIIARTNEGKSWLQLYFGIQAWLAGKKVGIYSGEMGSLMYGFRFDTMYKHFKNSGLIAGDVDLGKSDEPEIGAKSLKEYRAYIDGLVNGNYPDFRIFTQKDLQGQMTVNKMKILQDRFGFEYWGLDQLSLMADDRKGREERIRYGNISEDLARFTEECQVPIILLHQAGRKSAESKKKDAGATPELEDSFGSDAVTHHMTRLISFTQIENGAKIKVPKNRYGMKGQEFNAVWNIDFGIFKDMNTQDIKDNLF
jgi:Replicative DNA helicase